MRYYRRRDDSGNRVANHLLERCEDWLVHEAISYLELEEERRYAHREREIMAKHKR